MAAERSVEVSIETSTLADDAIGEGIASAVEWALRAESVARAILSVTLVDDEEIARLNAEYLSHEGPTDVISFPFDTPDDQVIGDIYIGAEQAVRQAAEAGVEVEEEIFRLALHGTLHVLGWDHPDDESRMTSPMFERQERLLADWLAARSDTLD